MINLYHLTDAIQIIRPGAEFTLVGNNLNDIEWIKVEGEPPSIEEIETALNQVETILMQQAAEKAAKKAELLAKLGLTEDDAKLLLS